MTRCRRCHAIIKSGEMYCDKCVKLNKHMSKNIKEAVMRDRRK